MKEMCAAQSFSHPFLLLPPHHPPQQLLGRLVSALLFWAHFLSRKGYRSDQCPAVLIPFIRGKYSGCLELGKEVENGSQTQPLVSTSSGSHLHTDGWEKPQRNKEKQPKEPQPHTLLITTHSLWVFQLWTSGLPGCVGPAWRAAAPAGSRACS